MPQATCLSLGQREQMPQQGKDERPRRRRTADHPHRNVSLSRFVLLAPSLPRSPAAPRRRQGGGVHASPPPECRVLHCTHSRVLAGTAN